MFPYPDPKTPVDALRLCNVADRVAAMHTGCDYLWYQCRYGVYGVAKRSFDTVADTAYTITLFPLACNCPDFKERGGYCKHLAYLWEQLEGAAAEGLTDHPADICAALQYAAEEADRYTCLCDRADRLVREVWAR